MAQQTPTSKRNLSRIYSSQRPALIRTVSELIRAGLLTGVDTPAKATPLPHSETHELGGEDEVLVDNVSTLCVNRTGVDIPIHAVVYVEDVGFDDDFGESRPAVALADVLDSAKLPPFGLTRDPIPNDGEGLVVRLGRVEGVDTATPGWLTPQTLYLDPATPGGMTATIPPTGLVYQIVDSVLADESSPVEDESQGELLVAIENLTDVVGTPIGKTLAFVTVATNYVVPLGVDVVLVDASVGGPITVTLPDPVTNTGRNIRVKKIDTGSATANRVLIVSAGGALVEDVLSFDLRKFLEIVELGTDGTQWWVAG